MHHLDEHRLLDLLREPRTAEEERHLARCPRCRQALEEWKETLAVYGELDSQELSDLEMHNLRTLFRQLGPSPQRKHWIARLVEPRASMAQATAARGALTPSLSEYRAEDLSVILQVAPSRERQRYEIHGTIQTGRENELEGSAVILFSDEGYADVVEPDRFGEFHFQGVPGGSYHLSCTLSNGDLRVEDLPVGDGGDPPDA